MRKTFFFLFLFFVFSLSAKEDYRLAYYPCNDWLAESITQLVKKGDIEIIYDVQGMRKLGDTNGGYLVFTFDGQAIALFNRGNKSYIVSEHNLLSKQARDHDLFSFAYASILYREIYVSGGEALTFKQIEKIFGAKIIPLTEENMRAILIIVNTVTEPEVVEKIEPEIIIKTIANTDE